MPSAGNLSRMLHRDREAARAAWIKASDTENEHERRESSDFLAYRDDGERVLDFHALRHTFITNLARGGVHPKVAQQLARHSTITLTMDRYSHTVIGELSDALTALPNLDGTSPEQTRQRATGTHGDISGQPVEPPSPQRPTRAREGNPSALGHLLGQKVFSDSQSMSLDGDEISSEIDQSHGSITAVTRRPKGNYSRHDTTENDRNRRGGDSNPRYGGEPVRRFSKPLLSATQPPLQKSVHI